MRRILFAICALFFILIQLSFSDFNRIGVDIPLDSLRKIYSGPVSGWPKPEIDSGVKWTELGVVPASPLKEGLKETKDLVQLGKVLFYDPRLSGSNQISCMSCHAPEMNWSDGRRVSLGHDQAANQRNSPSLENIWFFKNLFWDGRAGSLEEQLLGPISSKVEMHQELKVLPKKLKAIRGYEALFIAAYGDKRITTERVAKAIASYELTFTSRKSDFDYFLEGNEKRMSNQQIHGLHLFRTKARCMNCHSGPLFSDDDFHNLGLTYYKRSKYEDLGRYMVTKKPEDVGKFRTPGLRNVLRTRPWFHNGLFDNIEGVLNMYNNGMPQPKAGAGDEHDPLFPKTDVHIKRLHLSLEERNAIIAFLGAITTEPWRILTPELPQ